MKTDFSPLDGVRQLASAGSGSPWLSCLLIAGVNFLLYFKTLGFTFVGHDDMPLVEYARTLVNGPVDLAGLFGQSLLPGMFVYFYRPLMLFSLMLDAAVGGAASVYHLTNVLLHVSAACLLRAFLGKLGYPPRFALTAALLFSVHPALVQAVAWIPGRNDILLANMVLLSLLALAEFSRSNAARSLGLNFVFFTGALFTKETAIVAPVLFCLYPLLIEGRLPPKRAVAYALAGWGIIMAAWMFLKTHAVPWQEPPGAMLRNIAFNLPSTLYYLRNAFLPPLPAGAAGFSAAASFLSTAMILLAAFFILKAENARSGRVAFGGAWFLLFLVPTFALDNAALQHRIYVPLLGMPFIIFEAYVGLKHFGIGPRALQAAAAAVFLLFSAASYLDADKFANRLAFWSATLARTPGDPFARTNLAEFYRDAGFPRAAAREYERAYALEPRGTPNSTIYAYNLAEFSLRAGDDDRAEAVFRDVLKYRPNTSILLYRYGRLCRRQGRLREAEDLYVKAIAANPLFIDYHRELADLYRSQGRLDEAGARVAALIGLHDVEPGNLKLIDAGAGEWFNDILNRRR